MEEEQPKKARRNRLFRWLSNDSVIALSAILISMCALTVSIVEVRLMQQQQRALVYPHLDLSINYSGEGFSILTRNTGNGLAFIRDVRIWKGDRYFQDWLQLIDGLMPEGHTIDYDILRHNQIANQVIPPGESIMLIGLPWNAETRRLEERLRDLAFRICYCSVMDECFSLDALDQRPAPADCDRSRNPERSFND